MDRLFFSIVVPAHNEEHYIEATLERLAGLDYPKELYEVIVVENGSTDATFAFATKHEAGNVRVFSCPERGVSRARNFGSTHVSREAAWVLFLDADILLDAEFLQRISDFIVRA